MSELKGACIIGQSGGPTSVINASAYGVIRTALDSTASPPSTARSTASRACLPTACST